MLVCHDRRGRSSVAGMGRKADSVRTMGIESSSEKARKEAILKSGGGFIDYRDRKSRLSIENPLRGSV